MFDKATDANYPIHQLIEKRWSGVAFDPDRSVTDDQLNSIMEAARWAPSCFNEQPARFIVASRELNPTAWQHIFDCLVEKNQHWCINVPVLIVVCAKTTFSHNGSPNPWAVYDSGAAALSACLQARQLELMTHQMAGFDANALAQRFSIPEDFKPVAIIAAGYQMPEAHIPDDLTERELAPRLRKPLASIRSLGGTEGLW